MASDRKQRRIERLLERVEEAMDELDWESAHRIPLPEQPAAS